ncbi:RHS repeat-associated core domain-containing protein [Candidatus Hydrogenedentota bacterium]
MGGGYRWFNYDGIDMISEELGNGGGNMRWSYVHDPSRIIGTALGRRYTGNGYWNFHQDHLGSTRYLTAENEGLGLVATYGPYGDIIRRGGQSQTPEGMFTGKAWDQTTGLHYFPYRYLSPQWGGRWTQRDMLGMIDGPNQYWYVGADPINYADDTGQLKIKIPWVLHDLTPILELACAVGITREVMRDLHTPSGVAGHRKNDSYSHCLASCLIVRECGSDDLSIGLGVLKGEIRDSHLFSRT